MESCRLNYDNIFSMKYFLKDVFVRFISPKSSGLFHLDGT